MIPQSTRPNNAPTTTTFLQVYKILSVNLILKSQKSGNCIILHTSNPKIILDDIKRVFYADQSVRSSKIKKLVLD